MQSVITQKQRVVRDRIRGIERISFYPEVRTSDTPIVLLHGMWHGAWCWSSWQEVFAEKGWESHAISLPCHGNSDSLRPIRFCTLSYYMSHLAEEIGRHGNPPVLIAHSMGGGIAQRYFHGGDDLSAVILVASWPHSGILRATMKCVARDPLATLKATFQADVGPFVGTAQQCERLFLSAKSTMPAGDLQSTLCADSWLPVLEYNSPLWCPPTRPECPMLWISAGLDNIFSPDEGQDSAEYYDADHVTIPDAAHDLMLEPNAKETAYCVENWLVDHHIGNHPF